MAWGYYNLYFSPGGKAGSHRDIHNVKNMGIGKKHQSKNLQKFPSIKAMRKLAKWSELTFPNSGNLPKTCSDSGSVYARKMADS